MNIFTSKKASSIDSFYVAISFFGLAVFLLMALVFWNSVTSTKMNEDIWEQTEVGITARNNAQRAYDNLDNIGVLIYFALHLGILAMAFMLRTHPVVFVAAILMVGILALIAAPLSNAYDEVKTSSPELVTAATDLQKVNFIMDQLPRFEIIWAFITAIVTFGLAKSEGFI